MAHSIPLDRETVTQLGTVRSINNGFAQVAVQAAAACSTCAAKGSCVEGQQASERIIRIPIQEQLNPGDRIRITMEARHGMVAVGLMFGIPLVLLVGSVVVATHMGLGEALGALIGLVVLSIYGVIVWKLNDSIQKKLPVEIERLNEFPLDCEAFSKGSFEVSRPQR
jgi:positive regulator of sigma E activity